MAGTTVDTETPTLPPVPPPVGAPGPLVARSPRRWWILGLLAGLLVPTLAASALVRLPYYALAPGSVRPTEELVRLPGGDVHPSDGEVFFTTVALRRVTLFGALQGWIDDDIEVVHEDVILGGQDADDNRQFNLQLMDTSKQVATQVALEHLGYTVTVTGTGAFVAAVGSGLPADGLVEPGEVIVGVDSEDVAITEDLVRLIDAHAPGETASFTVEATDGTVREIEATLAGRDDDPESPVLGVEIQTRDLQYDFPFDVLIDSSNVGGPSAGLAFTLALLDALTPGELTGGLDVAVTGTITAQGDVGPVGGVAQKAAAVRRAGADAFLVPSREAAEARHRAGADVQIIPVDTLDDALEALATLGGNARALGHPGSEAA